MKITRREIIKKGVAASIVLAVPSVLLSVVKGLKEDDSDLAGMFDGCIKPDVIILDESSEDNLDFIAIEYDRETMNAPMPVWNMNLDYKPVSKNKFNNILHELRLYAIKNDVLIFSNKTHNDYPVKKLNLLIDMIRKNSIKGKYCYEINEDLYRPVSFIYAACYRHHQQLEARCRQRIKVDYI